jgi:hypothetical protein
VGPAVPVVTVAGIAVGPAVPVVTVAGIAVGPAVPVVTVAGSRTEGHAGTTAAGSAATAVDTAVGPVVPVAIGTGADTAVTGPGSRTEARAGTTVAGSAVTAATTAPVIADTNAATGRPAARRHRLGLRRKWRQLIRATSPQASRRQAHRRRPSTPGRLTW